MAFLSVTADLFCRDSGLKCPCRWTGEVEISKYTTLFRMKFYFLAVMSICVCLFMYPFYNSADICAKLYYAKKHIVSANTGS